ncbi:MAG: DoxX family protein [Lysobacterales bacterium]
MMNILDGYDSTTRRLSTAGEYIWPLGLRLILFWEFWEAGITKLRGENWFGEIPWAGWQKGFPFPFDVLPTDINWFMATWAEILFSIALLLGLFTRFAAVSLIVITMVATAAVHWPAEWDSLGALWDGYVITAKGAGNYKLPLLFLIMLLPLLFHGGGRISLDRVLVLMGQRGDPQDRAAIDTAGTAMVFTVLGLATVWVEPIWGGVLFAVAAVLGLKLTVSR